MNKKEMFEELFNHTVNVSLIITVIQLPTGAKEVITNTENLFEKFLYILNNYNDNLELNHNNEVKILDFIIL